MLLIIVPLIIIVFILLLFLRVFNNTGIMISKEMSMIFIVIQLLIALIFYLSLILWSKYNVKIFGQIPFNLIIILGGLSTGLMYASVNKTKLNTKLKVGIFLLSILPWFSIPLLATPYLGQIYFYEIVSPTLGFERETINENQEFRLDKMHRVFTGGGEYHYHFVQKCLCYEKVIETHGYPKEVEAKYDNIFIELEK